MAVQKDFFKYNPETDGNLTFNIDKALNENWDKVNEGLKEVEQTAGKIKSITVNGEEQAIDEEGNVNVDVPDPDLSGYAPMWTYGTEDLEEGVTPLPEGHLYFVI